MLKFALNKVPFAQLDKVNLLMEVHARNSIHVLTPIHHPILSAKLRISNQAVEVTKLKAKLRKTTKNSYNKIQVEVTKLKAKSRQTTLNT